MAMAPEQTGIGIRRHFTTEGSDPYDEVEWELRDARITNFRDGSVAFEQRDVEFPVGWSQNATNIVAQKYFRGPLGSPEREWSLRQVIDRVADTITAWGRRGGYFVDDSEADAFQAELKHLVLHQRAAFNSPVWFNIGVAGEPQQASACQPYDALVSTPEGLVPIGRLVEEGAVGAKVYDAHGLTKILAVKANGRKIVHRVHTKAGYTLDVTADHLVWRSTGMGTGRFVPAGQLRAGDQLEWHRRTSWGEGEILSRAVSEAALAGAQVRGTEMTVPEHLFTAPLPVVAAYLRSLFQAEGYVSLRERSAVVGLAMISEDLVRGMQSLLLRFGIFSRVRFATDRRPDRKGCWVLAIRTAGDRRRFADEIGFIDPKKADKLEASFAIPGQSASDVKRLEIERIEEVGETEVYDIQTESGEYLSGGLRVHNCFILAVDDTMRSILNWYVEEGTIFKGGSGSGINLSNIRSSYEQLKGGGTASGPVSFMRGADASAGTIKCVHADTPISTDQGVVPISRVEPGWRVVTSFGEKRVEAVHDNGRQPLLRLRTELGDEILCTRQHKFWVRGRGGETWREAGDLRSDDHLVLDLSAPYAGVRQHLVAPAPRPTRETRHALPSTLDEPFALWLGWVFGDGSITERQGAKFVAVQIGDSDPELVDRYETVTRGVFGDDIHLFTDRHLDKPDASASVRFCSSQVIRFLDTNGLRKGTAATVRVPEKISSSPSPVRAAFLAGLFEADGHVGNGYPTLSTISRAFAIDVHRLLLSLGIPSKLGRIDDRAAAYGKRPVHTVRIVGGEGVRRFAKLVGFVSERKSRALESAVARKNASPYETQWRIPHVASEFGAMWEAASGPLARALSPYCRYQQQRGLSLLGAQRLLERFPADLGRAAFAEDAMGDRIFLRATVEPAGEGATFDLTVEDVHEYEINGLISRNSGGKTRRAAKMVILNSDHPDIEDFIWCKAIEERKARVLRDNGFDMDLDGRDSHSTQYQNANNSVRVTDEFMQAVVDDADWHMRAVVTGEPLRTIKARQLFRQIAEAAWECADPGLQYDTTINRWHTASNTGRINASNPCSEYVHLDNSACNLASLNLLKFLKDDGSFDIEGFKAAVEVMFTAQEILVGSADYPTEKIGDNARRFRQLGLGYANLGAMLMALGLAYDSDEGRAWAAAVTSLMTGHAYATSARTAARMGPFAGYTENREPMNKVLAMHREAAEALDPGHAPAAVATAAQEAWDLAVEWADVCGVRNAQASVLAPTGCLVGGSLVPTERGLVRLRSLGDPEGQQWQDLGVEVATGDGERMATKFYVNGLEPVVTVETRRGYRIQGTPQHRVKVVDAAGEWEWKRLADLRPDDRVPMALNQLFGEPQAVPLPPLPEAYWTGEHHCRVPEVLTAELAELVGYFMGDGSLHSRGLRFCVTESDFDVVERLERLGKEAFGLAASVTPKQGYTEVAFNSVRLVMWWQACGFAKRSPSEGHSGKGYVAHVPDAVLHANDPEVYGAFLRGLYEADGTVTAGSPTLSSTSLEMISDLQVLLLALGVPTTRKVETRRTGWGQAPIAVVRPLNTAGSERWIEAVGFMGERKQAATVRSSIAQAARHDYIPLTRVLVDRLAPANDRLRRVLLMELARNRVSRRVATELFERTGDAELGRLLSFFYDRVVSAELGDEELTYDLSVPDGVTYVANGFVSHNTIGFLMDCDTTGIEPDLGLCKTKKLVGGGNMSIVNQTVPRALKRLGYPPEQIADIAAYIDEHKSILGAPHLSADHVPVFACSMGDNVIHYSGHVKMMAAVQPFISGAISKCVTGETLMATGDGLVRIGSLREDEEPDTFRHEVIEVASIDGTQKTDYFYYGGIRPVRTAVLRSGHRVTGTPNHRLLVAGRDGLDWRRLDELEAGEFVGVQYGSQMWSALPARLDDFVPTPGYGRQKQVRVPEVMTEELAFLLGACVAEGCVMRTNWTVSITNSVPAVLERVARAWQSELGVTAKINTPSDRCANVVVASKTVVEFLDHLGCGSRASEKRIPDTVLRSPRPMVLAFLQGLALDAYVTVATMPKWAICVDSPGLLDDLQAVLTNLGVLHGRISKLNKDNGKVYDEVYAAGEHAREMARLVPFLEPEKAATAARLTALAPSGQSTADDNLHFSPVESVVDAGEREVFDVSVPVTHAFVGNGIVNHNTINMPEEATVEEIEQLHIDAWRMGLKAVAVYRDNCKVAQPLSATKKKVTELVEAVVAEHLVQVVKQPVREKMPRLRNSKTLSFRVADCHGYVIVGQYDDGRPGEIFLKVAKQGSTLAGIMDAFAISVSHGLQYGVPLKAFVDMYTNMRFEPAGMTDDPDIRFASSLVDYIFRRMAVEYLPYEDRAELGILTVGERMQPTLPGVEEHATLTSTGSDVVPDPVAVVRPPMSPPEVEVVVPMASDAPYCYQCGMVMQRAGACFVCASCGTTSGCS